MRQQMKSLLQIVALIFAGMAPTLAAAQGAPTVTIDDQLRAQYTLVKMGADSSGPSVVEPGTVLAIQKGGILGVPYRDVSIVPTRYQDGAMHSPNTMMMKGIGKMFSKASLSQEQTTRLFQAGEKVYPSRIEVNAPKDKVTLGIIACDSCNNTNPPTYYKADVVFQFAKGYMATANAGQIEDQIAQVFTIDDSGGNQNGGGQGGNGDQGGQGNQAGGQQQQPQQPPAPPQEIKMGQTTDEVTAILGQPDKIVTLPTKKLYIYKDMKVTFVKGKVSDVQ